MTDPTRLEQLAMEISDGASVDWSSIGNGDPQAGRGPQVVLENLRAIDRIASTLRKQPGAVDPAQVRALNESFGDWLVEPAGSGSSPLQSGDTWGELEIREKLGSGAYADVFLAFDPALQRQVALKLFRFKDPELQLRMLAEGRRLARLDHPNVVRVHGAAGHDGLTGLWMEYLDGENLGEHLEGRSRFSTGEAALAGMEICKALAAIHEAGLLHRDVKLENVVRTRDGRLVLADLGSGMEIGDQLPAPVGTPLYLAPEILAGGSASRQSDLYGLGVALFRLATGRYPYPAANIAELILAQRAGLAPSVLDLRPGADPAFATIVSRLLAADPGERFGSAGEVYSALQGLITDQGSKRAGIRTAAGAVSLAVSLALVLVVLWNARSAPGPDQRFDYDLVLQTSRTGEPAVSLSGGEALYLGDTLSISLATGSAMYVYVFSEDDQGRAYGLYPIAAIGQQNPLPAGGPHPLPGTHNGQELSWRVDSLAGAERVHVVLSPNRPVDIESEYLKLPSPALPELSSSMFRSRGMGSLASAVPPEAASLAPLMQAVRVQTGEAQAAESPVHRVFEFRNLGERPHD